MRSVKGKVTNIVENMLITAAEHLSTISDQVEMNIEQNYGTVDQGESRYHVVQHTCTAFLAYQMGKLLELQLEEQNYKYKIQIETRY